MFFEGKMELIRKLSSNYTINIGMLPEAIRNDRQGSDKGMDEQ